MIRKIVMLFVAFLPGSFAIAAPAPAPAIVAAEFIHEPGAYPQCHASTIAETPDGGLVAAWFGGTHERHPDVCIWLRRFANGRWLPEVRKIKHVVLDPRRL